MMLRDTTLSGACCSCTSSSPFASPSRLPSPHTFPSAFSSSSVSSSLPCLPRLRSLRELLRCSTATSSSTAHFTPSPQGSIRAREGRQQLQRQPQHQPQQLQLQQQQREPQLQQQQKPQLQQQQLQALDLRGPPAGWRPCLCRDCSCADCGNFICPGCFAATKKNKQQEVAGQQVRESQQQQEPHGEQREQQEGKRQHKHYKQPHFEQQQQYCGVQQLCRAQQQQQSEQQQPRQHCYGKQQQQESEQQQPQCCREQQLWRGQQPQHGPQQQQDRERRLNKEQQLVKEEQRITQQHARRQGQECMVQQRRVHLQQRQRPSPPKTFIALHTVGAGMLLALGVLLITLAGGACHDDSSCCSGASWRCDSSSSRGSDGRVWRSRGTPPHDDASKVSSRISSAATRNSRKFSSPGTSSNSSSPSHALLQGLPVLLYTEATPTVIPVSPSSPLRPTAAGVQQHRCVRPRNRLLVLHDFSNAAVETKYSRFFSHLRVEGFILTLREFPSLDDDAEFLPLHFYGEYLYDHILLIAGNNKPLRVELAEAIRLFFDSGAAARDAAEASPSRTGRTTAAAALTNVFKEKAAAAAAALLPRWFPSGAPAELVDGAGGVADPAAGEREEKEEAAAAAAAAETRAAATTAGERTAAEASAERGVPDSKAAARAAAKDATGSPAAAAAVGAGRRAPPGREGKEEAAAAAAEMLVEEDAEWNRRICNELLQPRNIFFMVHPTAHSTVHAFAAEFMGVLLLETPEQRQAPQQQQPQRHIVLDVFSSAAAAALLREQQQHQQQQTRTTQQQPQATGEEGEEEDEEQQNAERSARTAHVLGGDLLQNVFLTTSLLQRHPHVVTPLAPGEVLLYGGSAHRVPALQPAKKRKLTVVGESQERRSSSSESGRLQVQPQLFAVLRAPPTAFWSLRGAADYATAFLDDIVGDSSSADTKRNGSSSSSKNDSSSAAREGLQEAATGEDLVLLTAMQARNSGRAVLLSSVDFCSNAFLSQQQQNSKKPPQQLVTSSEGERTAQQQQAVRVVNGRVCDEISAWAFQRRGVLKWSNMKHYITGTSDSPLMYRVKDSITFSVDLHQFTDGYWHPYQARDVQVEFTMLVPFLRLFLQPPALHDSPTFSTTFQAPDRQGVFKFVFIYNRQGFTALHFESLAPLRPLKTRDRPRFYASALPYYCCCLLTLLGVLLFAVLFLLHRGGGRRPRPLLRSAVFPKEGCCDSPTTSSISTSCSSSGKKVQ